MEKTDTRTYCTSRQQYLYTMVLGTPGSIAHSDDKTVLYLQPLIPPKRFDISPPLTAGNAQKV